MSLIAFQGMPGAYSDLACRTAFPGAATLPCESFQAAMAAVREGRADLAMLPPENSIVGRVGDMHALLPDSGLSIIGETFLRVEHCLLAPKGTRISDIKRIHSHPVALGQVKRLIAELGATAVVEYDTAGAAEIIAKLDSKADAAIASSLAGEMYGLEILRRNVEDEAHNTTRFYIMAREPLPVEPETPGLMTTFVFNVRNVPAALYKALGGFATNGVNMTRLESYMVNGSFTATQFLAEVEGHPAQSGLKHAFEELGFFCTDFKVLGTYKMDPYRLAHG
ncbi:MULTISPECIES: prephenate dehydratase [unclassified Acidocella]|uniref:prephenate dehydratase n=1 Tax=unclassified Acidocella TaxID=2648610 RepID=UPI00028EF5CB|nr:MULTISPECIES: prephenate dehydratase [unclassified Acidocella]EKM98787.1 prephenate dehydratase [Acidocella sp. MX-AZ02]WBO58807.1 prephenate dehydratase [Acidocella sp. MX-AZ03]